MEIDTQSWIDRMSKELGILMSNNMLLSMQIEKFEEQAKSDQNLIAALRQNGQQAHAALEELRAIAHPRNKKAAEAKKADA